MHYIRRNWPRCNDTLDWYIMCLIWACNSSIVQLFKILMFYFYCKYEITDLKMNKKRKWNGFKKTIAPVGIWTHNPQITMPPLYKLQPFSHSFWKKVIIHNSQYLSNFQTKFDQINTIWSAVSIPFQWCIDCAYCERRNIFNLKIKIVT